MQTETRDPDVLVAEGEELFAGGRLDEAEKRLAAAHAADPGNARAANDLAVVHLARSRARAEELLRAAIEHDPRSAGAHLNLAELLLESGRPDEAWHALDQLPEAAETDPDTRAEARDLRRRVDEALAPGGTGHGPPQPLSAPAGVATSFLRVLVTGVGRSGTTALVKALAAHPGLSPLPGPGAEMAYLRFFLDHVDRVEQYTQTRELFEAAGFDYAGVLGRAYVELIEDRFLLPALPRGCRGFVGKIGIGSRRQHDLLLTLLGGPRLVAVVRDGIEVVASRVRYMGETHEEACRRWGGQALDETRLFEELRASGGDVPLVVRHEELVAEPRRILGDVFTSLGLAPDEGAVRLLGSRLWHPTVDATGRPVNAGCAWEGLPDDLEGVDVGRTLDARPSPWGAWTDSERETFRDLCGPAMDALGYAVPK